MKPGMACLAGTIAFVGLAGAGDDHSAKGEVKEPKSKSRKDWCDWLQDEPGLLYESDDNPWFQSLSIDGRFQYQVAYVDGKDVNGRHFHDTYDEFRRVRLGGELEFLKYFKADLSVNLVDDRRFRDTLPAGLDWGYSTIDTLTFEVDFDRAFDLEVLDKLEFTYGKMKVRMGEEAHQSSRRILTIERSAISDKIGTEEGRPTGGVLSLGRGDWEMSLGAFSAEDDREGLAGWNDGHFYYASLEWEPSNEFRFIYDHTMNGDSGVGRALGYSWAGALSGVYEDDRWGMMVSGVYGDNGGLGEGNLRKRRQGDFWGFVATPWYWLVEDRLQFVVSYDYQASQESQGIRLSSRYIRASHDDPLIDVDRGRGDLSHTLYAGLNYHFCGDNTKIMAGASRTKLHARRGDVSASTYMLAFRSYF